MLPLVRTCVFVASALLASTADAHGRLGLPAPTFIASAKGKEHFAPYGVYGAKNPPAASYAASMSEADQKRREQTFTVNFKNNGFESLHQWIMDNQVAIQYEGRPAGGTPQCGYSDPNGTPQPLPAQLKWGSPAFQHPGPCEAWCDDTIVIPYQESCNAYVQNGNLDYDRAACAGKKTLTFHYVATHVAEPFQVYTNCVPLQGGGAGGGTGTTPASTPKPAPTTASPKPTTASPKPTTASPKPTSASSKPTSATPKPTTAAPTNSAVQRPVPTSTAASRKCVRRGE